MIKSFEDKRTATIFTGKLPKRFDRKLAQAARKKLMIIDSAQNLQDLEVPPGNRLEALQGDREGQFSIRVNKQYRICFRFNDGVAENVELTDYH